ncbi:MAG: phage portal protein, partial [Bacteroidetes bacterium]|nr:phage portal protein [Bacteroidota bacterium]
MRIEEEFMMLYCYRFLIISLVLFVCVSKAQNIAFLNTVSSDTAVNYYQTNIDNAITDDASKPKEQNRTKAPSLSLAFRNNNLTGEQFIEERKTYTPISLNQDIVTEKNSEDVYQYQMIDGTYCSNEPELNYGRLFTTFGAIATVDLIAYLYQREVWYREETTGFHTLNFNNDMKKWQYMDKIGHFKNVTIPAFDEKTGRPVMIHGFKREWPGQTRGIPEISHSLQEYEDITSFDAATTKKRTSESTLVLSVENDQQDPGDMGFSSLNSQTGAGIVTTQKSTPTPAPTNLGVDGVTSRVMDEATFNESSSVVILGAQQGDKLKAIPAATPAEKTGEFVDYKMGYLAPAFGMPVTIAKMQMGKAHSASRAELGMYADIISIKIGDLAADALNIIATAVLSEEIAAGRIQAPGFSDPILKAAWSNMNWVGNPLPDVDPLKTKMGI